MACTAGDLVRTSSLVVFRAGAGWCKQVTKTHNEQLTALLIHVRMPQMNSSKLTMLAGSPSHRPKLSMVLLEFDADCTT
jgi:hypothetical protein